MKRKICALYFTLSVLMLIGSAGAWAQTNSLGQNANIAPVYANGGAANVIIYNPAFKEWLLADTNAQISRLGVFVLIAFAVSALLFLISLGLIMACCRKYFGSKCLFDKFKFENCGQEGRFGIFIYDFRKEHIKASGPVCHMLGLECSGFLRRDAYLRLIRQGQNIGVYEKNHAAELVYEHGNETFFINVYVFPLLNRRGLLVGEYGFLQDISLFRRRELNYITCHNAVKSAFNTVEAYITANPLHAMVLHDNFDILRMNRAAVSILGADEKELYSLCFKEMLADPDMIDAFARHMRHAEENSFALNSFKIRDKEGRWRKVEIYTSPFSVAGYGNVLNSSLKTLE